MVTQKNIELEHVGRGHWNAGVVRTIVVGDKLRCIRVDLGAHTSKPKALEYAWNVLGQGRDGERVLRTALRTAINELPDGDTKAKLMAAYLVLVDARNAREAGNLDLARFLVDHARQQIA